MHLHLIIKVSCKWENEWRVILGDGQHHTNLGKPRHKWKGDTSIS